MMRTSRSSRRAGKGRGAEEGGFKSRKNTFKLTSTGERKEVRRCCTCLSSVANPFINLGPLGNKRLI